MKRSFSWLGFSTVAAALFFNAGCSTPAEHSFNNDFNQNFTTEPKYSVEDENADCFKITVHQGRAVSGQARGSGGQVRVIDAKRAVSTIAENEARKRGWQNWDVNYVLETDQGWMHVIVARVTRQNGVQFSAPSTNSP